MWESFSNQKYLKLRGVCVFRRPWNIPFARGSSSRHECVAEHWAGQEMKTPSDFARMSLLQASEFQQQTWRQKWLALVWTFPASSEAVGNSGILQLSLTCHVRDWVWLPFPFKVRTLNADQTGSQSVLACSPCLWSMRWTLSPRPTELSTVCVS